MLALAVTAQAAHTTTVVIDPAVANCSELGNTFTVNIENDESSSNSIAEVRIYEGTAGLAEFDCGTAPAGWTKAVDIDQGFGYCEYKETPSGNNDKIAPGNSLDFTFTGTMQPIACYSSFQVSTLDDATPTGQHQFSSPQVFIDCTAPQVDKSVGEPKIVLDSCEEETYSGEGNQACNYFATQDTEFSFTADESTEIDQCNLGFDGEEYGVNDGYCKLSYTVNGESETVISFESEGSLYQFLSEYTFPQDSEHLVEIECKDIAGNFTTVTETDFVETVPPQTTKTYDPATFYTNGTSDWINTSTLISLNAVDPQPHPSGLYSTNYWVISVPDSWCENPADNCKNFFAEKIDGEVVDENFYTAPFSIPQQSCHEIIFASRDNLGNTEELKYQCAFVDDTPPIITKTVGEPKVSCEDGNCDYFITKDTPITLTCTDQQPHPSNNVTIYWQYRVDEGNGFGDWIEDSRNNGEITFSFQENSVHELEYWCEDAVGNVSETMTETDFVDSEPPILTKTVVGEHQLGTCPPKEEGDRCVIREDTEIHLSVAETQANHAIGGAYCNWFVEWEGQPIDKGYFEEGDEEVVIMFDEDSEHILTVECQDALGNMLTDVETFLVDLTPPVTTKSYEGAQFPLEGYPKWVTPGTSVVMEAFDEKSDINATYYRVTRVPDEYCSNYTGFDSSQQGIVGGGLGYCAPLFACDLVEPGQPCSDQEFQYYSDPFTMEESCHLIEYYSVDTLWNMEDTKYQCVFVDETPPVGTKLVGIPSIECEEEELCEYFVSQKTPISLSCEDQSPHPVGNETVNWRFSTYENNDFNGTVTYSDWFSQEGPAEVYFEQDSLHDLEFYCEDKLGNENDVDLEYFFVDTVGPEISVSVSGPQVGDCPAKEEGDTCTIDGVTVINVDASDPLPHPVGGVTCDWSYEVVNGDSSGGEEGVTPPFEINFPEESEHYLTITCTDALENNSTYTNTFFVDKTPPVTTKTVGQPYYSNDLSEWVSSVTPISLSATDSEGPHDTGVSATYYRVTLLDSDEYCIDTIEDEFTCEDATGDGNYTEYTGEPFSIPEQSCHLIEAYSVDGVNKTEEVKKDCLFVDNTGPDTLKTVSEPKTEWDGSDSTFYSDIADQCGPDGLECWKVTLFTPINLACKDAPPHPVNNSKVHFKVELDGSDRYDATHLNYPNELVTKIYCQNVGGEFNEDTGYCDTDPIENFFFKETSEHQLEYYCEDKLGNTGESDSELFKVDGTAFTIQLNKKWNLISVPFVLQNPSIEEVFKNVKENIDSVWSYDAQGDKWSVYRPNDPTSSDLDTIEPGNGYWVIALEEDELVLGGSLFSPGATPPDKKLKAGWNLIGHYWTDGVNPPVYDGPDGEGREARCSLFSIGTNYLDKGWNALLTYWEPLNPYQWHTHSTPPDELPGLGYTNRMDPGAGYWLNVLEDGEVYSFSTVCGDAS